MMADSTSASGSGGSGHSERTPRNIPRINGLPSNPKITNYDSSRDDKSPSVDEQSLVGKRNKMTVLVHTCGRKSDKIGTNKPLGKLHLRIYFSF